MKVYFETYGCALNRADTSIMKYLVRDEGHEITNDLASADVIVINTCTVRLDTELKIIKRLKELRRYALNDGKRVVVAGCMVSAQPYTVSRVIPEASLISPQNIDKINQVLESRKRVIFLGGLRNTSILHPYVEGCIAELPISEGCLGNCSFCIVKLARRRLRSYPIEVIVRAVSEAVSSGAVEVDLTAQDTGSYGIDLYGKPRLADLIREVLTKVGGKYMIRVGMTNPDTLMNVVDDFIDVLRDAHVFKYAHIPLQSGSDRVLKIMRRRYSYDEFRSLIKELRFKVPGISVATDIIVGHPGETAQDFEQTVRAVKELMFDKIHLSQYTIRPRTEASWMPQIPEGEKKRRSSLLAKIVEDLGREINKEYVGSIASALITHRSFKRSLIGRLYNYKPVVIIGSEGGSFLGEDLRCRDVPVSIVDSSFIDLRGKIMDFDQP